MYRLHDNLASGNGYKCRLILCYLAEGTPWLPKGASTWRPIRPYGPGWREWLRCRATSPSNSPRGGPDREADPLLQRGDQLAWASRNATARRVASAAVRSLA